MNNTTYLENWNYYGTVEGKSGTLYNLYRLVDSLYFRNIYKGNDIEIIEEKLNLIFEDIEFIKQFGSWIKDMFLYYKEIFLNEKREDFCQFLCVDFYNFINQNGLDSVINKSLLNQNSLKINKFLSRIYNKLIPISLYGDLPFNSRRKIKKLSNEGKLSGVHSSELIEKKIVDKLYFDNPKYMLFLLEYVDYSECVDLFEYLPQQYKKLFNCLNDLCEDWDIEDEELKELISENKDCCMEIYSNYEEYIKPFKDLDLIVGTILQTKKRFTEVLVLNGIIK